MEEKLIYFNACSYSSVESEKKEEKGSNRLHLKNRISGDGKPVVAGCVARMHGLARCNISTFDRQPAPQNKQEKMSSKKKTKKGNNGTAPGTTNPANSSDSSSDAKLQNQLTTNSSESNNSGKSDEGNTPNTEQIAKTLQAISLLEHTRKPRKSDQEDPAAQRHDFWDTQPVPKLSKLYLLFRGISHSHYCSIG